MRKTAERSEIFFENPSFFAENFFISFYGENAILYYPLRWFFSPTSRGWNIMENQIDY